MTPVVIADVGLRPNMHAGRDVRCATPLRCYCDRPGCLGSWELSVHRVSEHRPGALRLLVEAQR
jgi:hypothetical protein